MNLVVASLIVLGSLLAFRSETMRRILPPALALLSTFVLAVPASAHPAPTTDVGFDVRPGMPILTEGRSPCTANFVWKNANTGDLFIGTAGHCLSRMTDRDGITWRYGTGPRVWVGDTPDTFGRRWGNAAGVFLGHAVYARVNFTSIAGLPDTDHVDFGLIQVRPDRRKVFKVWANIAHYGGPTGISDPSPMAGTKIHQYGWGLELAGNRADGVHGWDGVAAGRTQYQFTFDGPVITSGDSGSPVIDDQGRALGVVTGFLCPEAQSCAAGYARAQLVAVEIAHAEMRLRQAGIIGPNDVFYLPTTALPPRTQQDGRRVVGGAQSSYADGLIRARLRQL